VLIYAVAGKWNETRKHDIAIDLFRNAKFGVSGQILAEFAAVLDRKFRDVVSAAETDRWMEALSSFPLVPVDAALVQTGILHARRYQITYYDAAIIAAAERLGAPVLYTEDLNHGQVYGSVKVINPFSPN
jgi:predicted nucleic acid-binding protein